MNLHDRHVASLIDRGEREIYRKKYTKMTRKEGGFYFIGKAGAVRVGHTAKSSVPASRVFKAMLLNPERIKS